VHTYLVGPPFSFRIQSRDKVDACRFRVKKFYEDVKKDLFGFSIIPSM